jgi:hypothetical protein
LLKERWLLGNIHRIKVEVNIPRASGKYCFSIFTQVFCVSLPFCKFQFCKFCFVTCRWIVYMNVQLNTSNLNNQLVGFDIFTCAKILNINPLTSIASLLTSKIVGR